MSVTEDSGSNTVANLNEHQTGNAAFTEGAFRKYCGVCVIGDVGGERKLRGKFR
jgi:hypothetical protein